MSRPTFTGATGDGPGNIDCGWKDKCQKHQRAISYPNGGVLERGDLSGWPHPSSLGLKENSTKINDTHTTQKLFGQQVTAQNYRFQRHHVIPVEVFKNISDLKTNLGLLGYNINIHSENGICLPFRPQDLVWHHLQFHRGSHPAYTTIVQSKVQKIMNECGQYCDKGEQMKLWDEIEKTVTQCIKKIIDWNLMIHPWAVGLRDDATKLGWI